MSPSRVQFKVVLLCMLLPALGWLAPLGTARSAAWTQPEGQWFVDGSLSGSQAANSQVPGTTAALPDYRKMVGEVLAEYGFTGGITLVLDPSVRWTQVGNGRGAGNRYEGLDYVGIGSRMRLWSDDGNVISTQVTLRVPGGWSEKSPAQDGNTDPQGEIRLLYGHGFSVAGMHSFLDAELANRFRTQGFPNELHGDVTMGFTPLPNLQLIGQVFNVMSEPRSSAPGQSYWYGKGEISAVYEFSPGWSIQLGWTTTYAASHALRDSGPSISLWHRY